DHLASQSKMNNRVLSRSASRMRCALFFCLLIALGGRSSPAYPGDSAPVPLLANGRSVAWWFVFKFNSAAFPGSGGETTRRCPFGGDVQNYPFGEQFVYASSETASLQQGSGCLGETTTDPAGATFDEVYNGTFYYVVWNDQFYNDPVIKGCSESCSAPWG